MSTATIKQAGPLKAILVGTELIEISDLGTSKHTTSSGFSNIYQLLSGKGAVSGYAGLDASQLLELANFPSGTGLQVLRRNAGNTALEFASVGAGDMVLASAQTNTGIKTFLDTTMKLRNVANTFDAFFVNTVTADRIITIPDAAGTMIITGLTNQITNTELTAGAFAKITGVGTIASGTWQGTVVASAFLDADTMHLSVAQTVNGAKTFLDTNFLLRNVANTFNGSFVNTNTADRIYTLPDVAGTISLIAATETLLNKTLTTPTIVATGFTNMQHTHQAANTGGQLVATLALTATGTKDSTTFLRGDDTWAVPGGAGDMILAAVQTVTGAKTFGTIGGAVGKFILAGSTSGSTIVNAAAVAGSTTVTFQGVTGTIALLGDKLDAFAATTSAELATVISDETGSGLLVFDTSPTIVTPIIASFVNATHDHQAAAGGGTLLSTSALSDTVNIAYLNTANTYTAGQRQDFLGLLAGTAGLNVGGLAGNPTTQVNGDIWLNTSTNTLFGRINGVNIDLGAAGAGAPPFADGTSIVEGSIDPTKELRFEIDGFTTATVRVITPPDADITLVNTSNGLIADAQTGTFTTTKISTTNKALLNTAIVYNDQTNTFGDFAQIFADNQLFIQNPAATFTFQISAPGIAANRTITLPLLLGNDIMVTEAFAQTLTNKTMTAAGNTFSGFAIGTEVTGASTALTDTADIAYLNTDNTFLNEQTFNANVIHAARNQEDKGADVASGGIVTLGGDGNFFDITGTTTINEILGTGWQAGSEVVLQFDGILTITNNSGGTNDILTADGANITTAAGFVLGLRFNGTDWVEVFRNSVSAGGGKTMFVNTFKNNPNQNIKYIPLGSGDGNATENQVSFPVIFAITTTRLRVNCFAFSLSGGTPTGIVDVRDDGVSVNNTVTVNATGIFTDVSSSDAIAVDSLTNYKYDSASASGSMDIHVGSQYEET